MNKNIIGVLLVLTAITQPCRSQMVPDSVFGFKSFDNVRIAYSDEGTGQAVILIHGFISTGSNWYPTALRKELLERGFRVIIPDLRGNGNSEKPRDPAAYRNDAEVKDLEALMDHLELESCMTIGYSRGSIVLAKLLTRDRRISKAVLGGMGLDFTNPDWDRRIAFADAFMGRAELNDLTRGAVEFATSIGADLKILGYLQDYQPVTSTAELQDIRAETLVLCGDQDRDNGDPAELQANIPGSRLKLVEGTHNDTYKQENFAREVLSFLQLVK